jgi:hypothetical protein
MSQQENSMLVVAGIDGDPGDPFVAVTTPGGDLGAKVTPIVGVGNPFYVFANSGIPFDYAEGIIVNFSGAPVCDENTSVNNANIMAMLESPPLNKISAP